MRRRLFYQLIPLDGVASQVAGTGMAMTPDTWDTQPPLNINDDQIWPGMTERPKAQKVATEMVFCLTHACVGKSFVKSKKSMHRAASGQPKDIEEYERFISEAENEVEENYIRYCDIVNPLHFLTMCLGRSAITAMRIRVRLPKVRDQSITDAGRRELFQLALKVLDTDAAACAQMGLRRYMWLVRPFFAWGSWDSLIFVATSVRRQDGGLSSAESDGAWGRVQQVYDSHGELLNMKQALHMAVGRLTLKAWSANPPSGGVLEPAFIVALRSLLERNSTSGEERFASDITTLAGTDVLAPGGPAAWIDADTVSESSSGDMAFDLGDDFDVDTDWLF
ncbi:hypothetical protein LTR65_003373 [Meristemomyces frigidus]